MSAVQVKFKLHVTGLKCRFSDCAKKGNEGCMSNQCLTWTDSPLTSRACSKKNQLIIITNI